MRTLILAGFAVLLSMSASSAAEDIVLLHAAGSLRGVLTDIAGKFEVATSAKVKAKFGASGLLKDESLMAPGLRCSLPPIWSTRRPWRSPNAAVR